MGKRKHSDPEEHIARKIRKLERKMKKARRKRRNQRLSDTDSSEGDGKLAQETDARPHNDSEPEVELLREPNHEGVIPATENRMQVEVAEEVAPEAELDSSILNILGEEPVKEEKFSAAIHKDIASRWIDILINGLKEETRKDLLKNYNIPENLKLALPPLLNPEIKAAVNENVVKRDTILQEKQKYYACIITCIAELMTATLNSDARDPSVNKRTLQLLSDASRLLCHIHYSETLSRKNFLLSCLNKEVKDNIKELKRDHLLFGTDLTEKLKSMKAISKTGVELRPTPARPKQQPKSKQPEPTTSRALNWRGPPPQAPRGGFPRPSSTAGGRKQLAARQRDAARRDSKQRGRPARR